MEFYSHLNGWEHIKVHKPDLWDEIERVIATVDASACMTKVSKEKTKLGKILYSPSEMNARFKERLHALGWRQSVARYWVTADSELILRTMNMSADEQRVEIEASGRTPIRSHNETDFVKGRVAVEVQLAKYSFVAYDLFVKHMAFFVRGVIDVGVEVVPMKELQAHMSSGPPYYEGELYNLLRQGRSTPAVPLVLVGVAP